MRTTCFSRRGRRSYAKHRLAFGCAEQREAHQKRCVSCRQHTLPAPVGRIKRSGSANVERLREGCGRSCKLRPALTPSGLENSSGDCDARPSFPRSCVGTHTGLKVAKYGFPRRTVGTRNRCASYRQHTLPAPVGRIKRSGSANVERLREGCGRSCKLRPALRIPSFPRSCVGIHTGLKVAKYGFPRRTVGTRNRCASYRQHTLPAPVGRIKRSGSANVGRLREASRQAPAPRQTHPMP
nr:hypothetical protein [Methylomarinum sp. Ch1-1]MDP4521104.1 hypothetical protein [Methylomarinum sp. Ch1-1]